MSHGQRKWDVVGHGRPIPAVNRVAEHTSDGVGFALEGDFHGISALWKGI